MGPLDREIEEGAAAPLQAGALREADRQFRVAIEVERKAVVQLLDAAAAGAEFAAQFRLTRSLVRAPSVQIAAQPLVALLT